MELPAVPPRPGRGPLHRRGSLLPPAQGAGGRPPSGRDPGRPPYQRRHGSVHRGRGHPADGVQGHQSGRRARAGARPRLQGKLPGSAQHARGGHHRLAEVVQREHRCARSLGGCGRSRASVWPAHGGRPAGRRLRRDHRRRGAPPVPRAGGCRRARLRGTGRGDLRREIRIAARCGGWTAMTMKVLVTGTAGFIGSHVAMRLLERGDDVVGVDNLNDYYDVTLKQARLDRFRHHPRYTHVHADIADRAAMESLFATHRPQRVVHLAAQAGVRYAAENPHIYVSSNVTGFLHVLEGCRHHSVEHLVFASTSSVYGANRAMPFSEHQSAEHPLTLYAATKKANEQMAHSYAHLYGTPCTGLRFFTVYGPWGRPDMALFLFTRAILSGEPIKVFNHGRHQRSFTYIDDIVEGVIRSLDRPPTVDSGWNAMDPDPSSSGVAPFRLFNIGNEQPVELLAYIRRLEQCLGREAIMDLLPLQPGDVPDTAADVSELRQATGYAPQVSVEEGVERFVRWYRDYHGV